MRLKAAILLALAAFTSPAWSQTATDGDSIRLGPERIRLANIDAAAAVVVGNCERSATASRMVSSLMGGVGIS